MDVGVVEISEKPQIAALGMGELDGRIKQISAVSFESKRKKILENKCEPGMNRNEKEWRQQGFALK